MKKDKEAEDLKSRALAYFLKTYGDDDDSYEIKNKDEGDSRKVSELMEKSVASLKIIK